MNAGGPSEKYERLSYVTNTAIRQRCSLKGDVVTKIEKGILRWLVAKEILKEKKEDVSLPLMTRRKGNIIVLACFCRQAGLLFVSFEGGAYDTATI